MNERIRELALQAGDYVNSVYTPPVRSKTPGKIWEDGHVNWHVQFNQKFAELIVRECIDMIKPTSDHEAFAQNYLGGVDGLELLDDKIKKIKEHFGVSK